VKRLLVIPVMFIYLLAVSGIMITAHYCGQQMESVSIFAQKSTGCAEGECGDESEKNDGCCNDKVVAAKVTTAQNTVNSYKVKVVDQLIALAVPGTLFIAHNNTAFVSSSIVAHHCNAPPGLWQQIPLYRLQSRFTYYG